MVVTAVVLMSVELAITVWPEVSVRVCQFHQIQGQLRWLTAHFRTKTRGGKTQQRRKKSRSRSRSRSRGPNKSAKSPTGSKSPRQSGSGSNAKFDSNSDSDSDTSDSDSEAVDALFAEDEEDQDGEDDENDEGEASILPVSQRPFFRLVLNAYRKLQRCRQREEWDSMVAEFEHSVHAACKGEAHLDKDDAESIIRYYMETWLSAPWRGEEDRPKRSRMCCF